MNKVYHISVKKFIISLMIFFAAQNSMAENRGTWVEYQLSGTLPTEWSRAVGENCLIFVGKNEPLVLAYDIISGAWHQENISTSLSWNSTAEAGSNVAFVWNDSIMTAYSAKTQSFATLAYQGSLLDNSELMRGCSENLAYFVSDQYFYVFDAENAQWYSHPISGLGSINKKFVYEKNGYLLLKLHDSDNNQKIVAFNEYSKNFFERNYSFLANIEVLDYGFVAWNYSTSLPENDRFFGGFSAIHNTWHEYKLSTFSAIPTTNDAEDIHPRTVFMFRNKEELQYPNTRHNFYVFNSQYPNFVTKTYEYSEENFNIHDAYNGAGMAIQAFRNMSDNNIQHLIYTGSTHSFSDIITSPINFNGTWGWHACGGNFYMAWDIDRVMGEHADNLLTGSALQPDGVQSNNIYLTPNVSDNWGIIISKSPTSDSAYIYSYNMQNPQHVTCLKKGGPCFSKLFRENVAGFIVYNGTNNKALLYAPSSDQWRQKNLGSENPVHRVTRDFIYYYQESSGLLSIFDGVSNQELGLPFGQSGISAIDNYTYATDDFILAYTSDNKYVSYSTFTRSANEYPSERYTYTYGDESILVLKKDYYTFLTYNALSDCFIPLTLSDTLGMCRNILTGGKTALLLTKNGYLLAFDPYKDTETAVEKKTQGYVAPAAFNMAQNFPNPFNPSTTISYSVSEKTNVKLAVYNLLGQEVSVFIDKEHTPGNYKVKFDGSNLASGIYFYKIISDKFVETKKMLLIK